MAMAIEKFCFVIKKYLQDCSFLEVDEKKLAASI